MGFVVSSIAELCEQNNIVNSVRMDDWTTELAIIATDDGKVSM